jgi:hypothetical protein
MRLDDVTLYVPARNAEATLATCLAAARSLDPSPARILVVVDPASRDRTVEIARATAGVQTVEQDATGLPAARNLAFAEARTGWVASIDADVTVAPDWLGALWTARARFPEAAAIAGRTEERVLGLADAWRALMMPHHWGAHPVDGPFMIVSEAIFRRDAVVSVGGYRETLVRYGDDSRLCQDLRDAGHRLAYTPAARALHERHDDLASVLDLRWDYSAPRQAHRLDDLAGLAGKLAVNAEYGRLAVLRALAAGEPLLALVGAVLPLHHVVRDVAALCAGRALMPAASRIGSLACAAAAPSSVISEVTRGVLAKSGEGPGWRAPRWADLEDAGVRAPGLAWKSWAPFERAVADALASWIAECAPLLRDAEAAAFASRGDARARGI